MAKFSRVPKLSKQYQETLLISFCKALVEIKTPEEAAHFLKDLLSKQEADMLAMRIEIAKMLIDGSTYDAIKAHLKVSEGTISRVSIWLKTSGEGYRTIVNRIKLEKSEKQKSSEEREKIVSWNTIKRQRPLYFWPELILEEFVKNAKQREKDRMRKILEKFDTKSEVYEHLDMLLRQDHSPPKL